MPRVGRGGGGIIAGLGIFNPGGRVRRRGCREITLFRGVENEAIWLVVN